MEENYDGMKSFYGLSIEEKDDHEEIANNNFFKQMHPGFKEDISEVFKNP